jgi:ankyrin repeat protein
MYSKPEIIKYIIDKEINLEHNNNNGWRPIHFICRYHSPSLIKYIINKNVNIDCITNTGWKPIHFIYRYSTLEMMSLILFKCEEKNYNINTKVKLYWYNIYGYNIVDLLIMNKILLNKDKEIMIYILNMTYKIN